MELSKPEILIARKKHEHAIADKLKKQGEIIQKLLVSKWDRNVWKPWPKLKP